MPIRIRWLLLVTFAMRVWLIFRYRFDSDEPQHMHVAWGWAHGFIQYRDVFDNHMPLFHLLTAPLRSDVRDADRQRYQPEHDPEIVGPILERA